MPPKQPPKKPVKIAPKVAPEDPSESGPSFDMPGQPGPEDVGYHVWKIAGVDTTFDQRVLIFVAYQLYRDGQRPLIREEIFKLVAKMLKIESHACHSLHKLLDRFDKPEDKLTIQHRKFTENDLQVILDKIGSILVQMRQEDETYKDIQRNLEGLTSRIPFVAIPHTPTWGYQPIYIDKLLIIHAFGHSCKDHQGNDLDDSYVKDLIQVKLFPGKNGKSSIYTKLRDKNHPISQKVTFVMNSCEEFKEHFGKKAHEMHKDYAKEKNLPEPLLVLPSNTSQTDLATTGMNEMSLTATTSDLPQPSKQNTGTDDFDDLFDYEAYEDQDTEENSPPPSGTSINDPTGKEKGKGKERKERESSSNSPGGGGSKKPEKKKVRREGKT